MSFTVVPHLINVVINREKEEEKGTHIGKIEVALGHSQRSFARTVHSAHFLHSAPLCYTGSLCSQACILTSLIPSWDSCDP